MRFALLVLLTASAAFFDVATSRPFSVFDAIPYILDVFDPPPHLDPVDAMIDDMVDYMWDEMEYPELEPDYLCPDDPDYELQGLKIENQDYPNYQDSSNYEVQELTPEQDLSNVQDPSNYEFQGFKLENQDSPNYEVKELSPEYYYDSSKYEELTPDQEQDYQDFLSTYYSYLSDYYYYVSDHPPTGEPQWESHNGGDE